MRRTPTALLLVSTALGSADANVEIGAIGGVHLFSRNSELGVFDGPDAPSQRNSVLAGLRIGAFALDVVGVEAELGIIPTEARETGFGVVDLTYRAHVVAQLRAKNPDHKVIPFALVGVGAFAVVSSNNVHYRNDRTRTITSDTDAAYYIGVGVKHRTGEQWGTPWGLRADARVLAVPSSENTQPPDPDIQRGTADFEVMVSIYADIAPRPARSAASARRSTSHSDGDGDGVLGAADTDVPGVVEGPGRDTDGDGIGDRADRCPAEAEDKDGFEDDDGCVDADNDADGVADGLDTCGDASETRNGFRDDDGCPDTVPAAVVKLTTGTAKISFRIASLELSPKSRKVLDAAVPVLIANPDVRLEIRVHTDGKDDQELAGRRAAAVVAYLVGKGIDGARLSAKGFGDSPPRRVELRLPGAR